MPKIHPITKWSKKLGLSYAEVARRANVSPALITRIRLGSRYASIPAAHRICRVLDNKFDPVEIVNPELRGYFAHSLTSCQ